MHRKLAYVLLSGLVAALLVSSLLIVAARAGMPTLPSTEPPGLLEAASAPTASCTPPLCLAWSSVESDLTTSLAWGDYDNDGDLDLATANYSDWDPAPIYLYRNDGGALVLAQSLSTGFTTSLAWGDLDNDGDLDLASGDSMGFFNLYKNEGGVLEGFFAHSITGNITSLAWGDMNSDSYLDLALGCNGDSNLVFVNVSGTFSATAAWASDESDYTTSVAWGDVDSDGDLDLAAGNYNQPNRLYANEGGLLSTSAVWSSNEADKTQDLAWGDLDGDWDLDLFVGNDGPNRLYINYGGGLVPGAIWSTAENDNTTSVAWGDVDGDGRLEAAAGNYGQPLRLYSTEDFLMSNKAIWSSAKPDNISSVAWGDYDGDGDLDLAAGNEGPNRLYRNELGSLGSTAYWASPESDATRSLAWGDMDNDGNFDLAVGNEDQPLRVYRSEYSDLTLAWSSALSDTTRSVAWGDVDGDGDLDLAAGNWGKASFAGGQPNRLYLNEGGMLENAPSWSTDENDHTNSVAWGDVDGDGDLDLAAGNGITPYGENNRLYLNEGGTLNPAAVWYSEERDDTTSLAWGDVDNDGDLDLAVGNCGYGEPNRLYRNDNGVLSASATWASNEKDKTLSLAWGDVDSDGDLDLLVGNNGPIRLYRNDNGTLTASAAWASFEVDPTPGLALGDYDGDGDLDLAAATAYYSDSGPVRVYRNDRGVFTSEAAWISNESGKTWAVAWADFDFDGDLDLAAGNQNSPNRLYMNMRDALALPGAIPVVTIYNDIARGDGYAMASVQETPVISITYAIFGPLPNRVSHIRAWYSLDGGGEWLEAVAAAGAITTNLEMDGFYTYPWDVLASGFFGQSDNVIFRIEAVPAITTFFNTTPGPYLYGQYATNSFPFRVRGTQVRVMDEDGPAANALVYRLEDGKMNGGRLIVDGAGHAFRTNAQGYLSGRGALTAGDQLLAVQPISQTETYQLFYTSGTPIPSGVDAFTVSGGGVQTLTISAENPLLIFNLDVSLEWDASQDPLYLEQLAANLQRASEYLYDFTNGQVTLGETNIYQNRDFWDTAHITVRASNRLRPWAVEGGVVFTDTQAAYGDNLVYSPGQLAIGSVWNRYGNPGQAMGDDWPIILAHELSHYLFFLDDVYMGIDPESGQLVSVDTCSGSAMGDLYTDPANTEFIYDPDVWAANCANTLSNLSTGMTEWAVLESWYPSLQYPGSLNAGPAGMPFDFTEVQIHLPYTETQVLVDPTFYVVYEGGLSASSAARAYLEKPGERLINLGSPFGGQNRVLALGAEAGDRLCVFDPTHGQFGCETVSAGDDVLALRADASWQPVTTLTPVTTSTLLLEVQQSNPEAPGAALALYARLFPEYGAPYDAVPLHYGSGVYSATLNVEEVTMAGAVQVYVAGDAAPRRETVLSFSVGGNPGYSRGSMGSGFLRGLGYSRGSMGSGAQRASNAPILSPDGNLIFFSEAETDFITGTLFMAQAMSGLPELPPGRALVGQGYQLTASPGAALPAGSVSIQYTQNDVLQAGVQEQDLALYYYNGAAWQELPTTRNAYTNLISAPSQGAGIYAVLAAIRMQLYGPGWNLVSYPLRASQPVTQALASIEGSYSLVYGFDAAMLPEDPWLVYGVDAPDWVNYLEQMEFGKGYWIMASETITLYMADQGNALADMANLPIPPALYYGTVQARPGFEPAAGQRVTAYVNGKPCGQSRTWLEAGQVVYRLAVWGVDGCAVAGGTVTFQVDGKPMAARAAWDNKQIWPLDMAPYHQVFIPLVRQNP